MGTTTRSPLELVVAELAKPAMPGTSSPTMSASSTTTATLLSPTRPNRSRQVGGVCSLACVIWDIIYVRFATIGPKSCRGPSTPPTPTRSDGRARVRRGEHIRGATLCTPKKTIRPHSGLRRPNDPVSRREATRDRRRRRAARPSARGRMVASEAPGPRQIDGQLRRAAGRLAQRSHRPLQAAAAQRVVSH